MADKVDILVGTDGDLQFYDGDIMTGSADSQHVEHILVAVPGAYKQYPLIGANIRSLVGGKLDVEARRNIKLQLASDGYKAKNVAAAAGTLTIEI